MIDHYGQFQNGRRKNDGFYCFIVHGFLKFHVTNGVLVSDLTF